VPVELNSRCCDALLLRLRRPGTLISKERSLQEVWQGIPVTDPADSCCPPEHRP
jgi:DNA-binding winged helix-turn-helix (wHTH) protein